MGKISRQACDLISRSELKKALHNFFDGKVIDESTYILRDVFCYIDNAPSVEYTFEEAFQKTICDQRLYCPMRPQGEWIDTGYMEEYWSEEYRCSVCGAKDHWHNFCPNCGADMRKGSAENETDN